MGLFSRSKPKIKIESTKKDCFSGWIKCTGCSELIHANELKDNLNCCPKCSYHYRLCISERIKLVVDDYSFEEKFSDLKPLDPLNFIDVKKYSDRLEEAKQKATHDEAVIVGTADINDIKIAIAILDFSFMGGSMGCVVGERITLIIEYAIANRLPVVIISASGGARMQESTLSLMQMAKTAAALAKLHKKNLPYISIMTNPTTGGVTASFASLGDIILAEPGSLIAFAGPRVVEQTIGQKLPEGAQRAEFLLEKGMLDRIVPRSKMKEEISFFIKFLRNNERILLSGVEEKEMLDEKMTRRLKELMKFTDNKIKK